MKNDLRHESIYSEADIRYFRRSVMYIDQTDFRSVGLVFTLKGSSDYTLRIGCDKQRTIETRRRVEK
jgi:hypothetical protein